MPGHRFDPAKMTALSREGLTTKEIAEVVGCSEMTVRRALRPGLHKYKQVRKKKGRCPVCKWPTNKFKGKDNYCKRHMHMRKYHEQGLPFPERKPPSPPKRRAPGPTKEIDYRRNAGCTITLENRKTGELRTLTAYGNTFEAVEEICYKAKPDECVASISTYRTIMADMNGLRGSNGTGSFDPYKVERFFLARANREDLLPPRAFLPDRERSREKILRARRRV